MSVCPMKLQKEPRLHLQHWGLHLQIFWNNPTLPDPSFTDGETKAQRERTCPPGRPPANHSQFYLPDRVTPAGDTEQTTEGVQLEFRPPPRLGCVPETLWLFWESQRDSRCILPGSTSPPSAAENSRCGPGPSGAADAKNRHQRPRFCMTDKNNQRLGQSPALRSGFRPW